MSLRRPPTVSAPAAPAKSLRSVLQVGTKSQVTKLCESASKVFHQPYTIAGKPAIEVEDLDDLRLFKELDEVPIDAYVEASVLKAFVRQSLYVALLNEFERDHTDKEKNYITSVKESHLWFYMRGAYPNIFGTDQLDIVLKAYSGYLSSEHGNDEDYKDAREKSSQHNISMFWLPEILKYCNNLDPEKYEFAASDPEVQSELVLFAAQLIDAYRKYQTLEQRVMLLDIDEDKRFSFS